jgi:hypothetical protein
VSDPGRRNRRRCPTLASRILHAFAVAGNLGGDFAEANVGGDGGCRAFITFKLGTPNKIPPVTGGLENEALGLNNGQTVVGWCEDNHAAAPGRLNGQIVGSATVNGYTLPTRWVIAPK